MQCSIAMTCRPFCLRFGGGSWSFGRVSIWSSPPVHPARPTIHDVPSQVNLLFPLGGHGLKGDTTIVECYGHPSQSCDADCNVLQLEVCCAPVKYDALRCATRGPGIGFCCVKVKRQQNVVGVQPLLQPMVRGPRGAVDRNTHNEGTHWQRPSARVQQGREHPVLQDQAMQVLRAGRVCECTREYRCR